MLALVTQLQLAKEALKPFRAAFLQYDQTRPYSTNPRVYVVRSDFEQASQILDLLGTQPDIDPPVEGRTEVEDAYYKAIHASKAHTTVRTKFLGNILASTMCNAAEFNWRHMLLEARAERDQAYFVIAILAAIIENQD